MPKPSAVEQCTIFPGHFFFLCSPFRSAPCDTMPKPSAVIFPGHFFFLCSPLRSAACDNAETKCSRTERGEGGRGRVCGNEFKIIHSHELWYNQYVHALKNCEWMNTNTIYYFRQVCEASGPPIWKLVRVWKGNTGPSDYESAFDEAFGGTCIRKKGAWQNPYRESVQVTELYFQRQFLIKIYVRIDVSKQKCYWILLNTLVGQLSHSFLISYTYEVAFY